MTNVLLWIAVIVIGSFDVIGMVEWVKSVVRKGKGKWVWPTASLLWSAIISYYISQFTPVKEVANIGFTFVTIMSFVELFGYNVIVRWMFHVVDTAIGVDDIHIEHIQPDPSKTVVNLVAQDLEVKSETPKV
jgi:hypothetical protein